MSSQKPGESALLFSPSFSSFSRLGIRGGSVALQVLPASYSWHTDMAKRLHALQPSLLVSDSFGLAPGNPVVDATAASM